MIKILAEKIHDGRFLRLIGHMLKAGYLEDWRWHATLSGSPQGGIASPLLSHIYLGRPDPDRSKRLLPPDNPRIPQHPQALRAIVRNRSRPPRGFWGLSAAGLPRAPPL